MGAAEALSGIATGAIQPETMTDADFASLGGLVDKCTIRLTEVGLPSFVYGKEGGEGTIKLNGKLIELPSSGSGTYAEDGLSVATRSTDEEYGDDGRREAELVVKLPGAKDELGFRGYEECPQAS